MLLREDSQPEPRQRSPRTDPDMRDGDSAHGNSGEPAGDRNANDSDRDVENELPEDNPERQDEFEDLVEEFEGDGRGGDQELVAHLGMDPKKERDDNPVEEVGSGANGDTDPPIENYGKLTVAQVLDRAKGLKPHQVNRVLAFEQAHRNRKTLVAKLTRLSTRPN